jgi:hypothetical protein
LLGEELTSHTCSYRATHLPHGKNNNRSEHFSLAVSELPQIPIATCPVDRRNQILFTSQSPGEIISGLLLSMDRQEDKGKWKKKKKGKTLQPSPPQVVQ